MSRLSRLVNEVRLEEATYYDKNTKTYHMTGMDRTHKERKSTKKAALLGAGLGAGAGAGLGALATGSGYGALGAAPAGALWGGIIGAVAKASSNKRKLKREAKAGKGTKSRVGLKTLGDERISIKRHD